MAAIRPLPGPSKLSRILDLPGFCADLHPHFPKRLIQWPFLPIRRMPTGLSARTFLQPRFERDSKDRPIYVARVLNHLGAMHRINLKQFTYSFEAVHRREQGVILEQPLANLACDPFIFGSGLLVQATVVAN